MKAWPFLVLFAVVMPQFSRATEVDNFTDRDVSLADSRELLNSRMNLRIEGAMTKTNLKFDCDRDPMATHEYFYKALYKKIGGFFWAKYENEVVLDSEIEKRKTKKKDSVYRDLNFLNSPASSLVNFGAIVNVGNYQVGTDKLGHFIGVGKIYFDLMRNEQKTLKEAMEYGQHTENSFFGLTTTGIFSFGDLVANFEGMHFWQALFDGENSYLLCEGGDLKQRRSFDWLDYVSDAWDEAINCSAFRTETIKHKVYNRIKGNTCPVQPLRSETIQRYSKTPVKILNF